MCPLGKPVSLLSVHSQVPESTEGFPLSHAGHAVLNTRALVWINAPPSLSWNSSKYLNQGPCIVIQHKPWHITEVGQARNPRLPGKEFKEKTGSGQEAAWLSVGAGELTCWLQPWVYITGTSEIVRNTPLISSEEIKASFQSRSTSPTFPRSSVVCRLRSG